MKILKLEDLYKLTCVKLMQKRFYGILPKYHSGKIPTKFEILNTNTRQKFDVVLETHNNRSKTNSINSKIGTTWNNLPFEIKETKFRTLYTFVKRVKAVYLSKYTTQCIDKNCYVCNL